MNSDFVKAIFSNVLFSIGVILTIFGFGRGADTAVKLAVFDRYPLDSWEETRCDTEYQYAIAAEPTTDALTLEGSATDSTQTTTNDDTQNRKADALEAKAACQVQVENQRKTKQVEHIVSAITLLTSGVVLMVAFRGQMFRSAKK